MIRIFLSVFFCLWAVLATAQTSTNTYDAELAKRLGADQYGMRKYIMDNLKSGPTKITDKARAAEIQKAHLKNIEKLAAEGKLVVAGPYMDAGDVRGIFIFAVSTIEEAKALTETDPAIKAGVLTMELRPFYCSAALMEINNIHKKLEKKSVAD